MINRVLHLVAGLYNLTVNTGDLQDLDILREWKRGTTLHYQVYTVKIVLK